jgi:tetratricopeptide (TPR) repeat protein
MNCPHCNAQVGPNDRFCSSCGKRIEQPAKPAFCGQCGTKLTAGAKFCPECGASTAHDAPAPTRAAPSTTEAGAVQGTLEQISDMIRAGLADKAKEMAESYIQGQAGEPDGWLALGDAEVELEDYAAAEKAYRHALQLDPSSYQAYTRLGILARTQNHDDRAIQFYQQALDLNPRYAQAYSSMAIIEMRRGNDRQAVEYAEKGWGLDRSDPVIAANLSVAYHHMGRYEDRDRMYEEARRLGYPSLEALDGLFSGELTM